MATFTTRFDLPTQPQCPLCRLELIPASTVYIDSIAYCHACESFARHKTHNLLLATFHLHPDSRHWSARNGLRFFTPQIDAPRNVAAHLFHALPSS
jgi:hypothetical protein